MRTLLMFTLAAVAAAHPRYFVERILENADGESCTLRPNQGFKGHGDPIPSSDVAFTILSRSEAEQPQAVTDVCPGHTYDLEVKLPGPVEWLLTTTAGRFRDATDSCQNRLFTGNHERTTNIRTTLITPCQELPDAIDIQVTYADGKDSAFQYADLRLPVSLDCECQSSDEEGVVEDLPPPPALAADDVPEQPKMY